MGDWSRWFEVLVPLFTAAVLGGVLGLEREFRGRWAGLRTLMLVSMGCAVFTLVGVELAKTNPPEVSRVIQGVAAGIGFIGAGTILKLDDKGKVKGLTTASAVWMSAGIGTAAGLRLYPLAVIATLLALTILVALGRLEVLLPIAKHDDEETPGGKSG